ncbi:hypothetical protein [Nocardioides sp. Kera G14]|uniref:hypothetical protein n=1 Tax=Nocardioides sp. Kera G14 TaxID=2884264 RepID=UPI001D11FFC5|nr:hypothetical protein [Nocardioides sp. Kera G14]UDY25431.1 hypothetical protein LH076_15215 [Nocardioides sp. Kera G14]
MDHRGVESDHEEAETDGEEGQGLVLREHPASDGRSVELVATALAEESLARVQAFWVQRLRSAPTAVLADGARTASALAALASALRQA